MRFSARVLLPCAVALACHRVGTTLPPLPAATVAMRSASGVDVGMLQLDRVAGGVQLSGTLSGLPAGAHGIHIHQVGRCDPPDFASAGPHLNPAGAQHGLDNPAGPHAGDLSGITVDGSGRATVKLTTARVTLDAAAGGLFDADGSAIVIHASEDDQRTDPSGNSGARIACGVVTRS